MYLYVKELNQKTPVSSDVINDRNGITLTESTDIKIRWAEYCSELYEQKDCGTSTTRELLPEHVEPEPPPLLDEVRKAMGDISIGKSPGCDDIPAELWKASGEDGVNIMWKLCNKIRRKT